MNTRLAIIRSEGKEHLCYREEECFVDVSYPMVTFTKGEDDFEIVKCDHPSMEETFLYQESRLSIVIEMYHNGWPALSLKDPVTHEIYTVLTVNLEDKAHSHCLTGHSWTSTTILMPWSSFCPTNWLRIQVIDVRAVG